MFVVHTYSRLVVNRTRVLSRDAIAKPDYCFLILSVILSVTFASSNVRYNCHCSFEKVRPAFLSNGTFLGDFLHMPIRNTLAWMRTNRKSYTWAIILAVVTELKDCSRSQALEVTYAKGVLQLSAVADEPRP